MTTEPGDAVPEPVDRPRVSRRGLRVGFVPGVTLTKWRRIWAERFRSSLEVVELAQDDQRRALVEGRVDLAFVRLPIDRSGLHLITLYDEVPVVWMSGDHLLAALDEVSSDDLVDERVITHADPGSIELATWSAAVLRVPMSIARSGSRKDLVHRVVTDAEPTTIGLAWLVTNDHPLVEEFIGVVRGRSATSSRSAQERAGRSTPAPATRTSPKARRPRPRATRRGR
ncbi:LysR substrate-binding domain-containing protein [Aestuariimicrobium kwangyangense]|uniref:LysR substrate-binding domain-containing protein n=1 Tax=Aestuariimicrobium kwangyangense TaxID=396389 RepID=UPI0003B4F9A1|nr:LysR substrate-binding domain-containing protein [Aestuariimicrobium kwangyangense]